MRTTLTTAVAAAALLALAAPATAQTATQAPSVQLNIPALCAFTDVITATGSNTSLSGATASSGTVTITQLGNSLTTPTGLQAWSASLSLTAYCNSFGTDITVTSVNGGLVRSGVTLTGPAADGFDARAAYSFSLTYPTINAAGTNGSASITGTATGPANDGSAVPVVVTSSNVGPRLGNPNAPSLSGGAITLSLTGVVAPIEAGDAPIAGAYTDQLQVTLTAEL